MKTGIIVCGLNGSGKSTVGKALAEKLGFHFIDNETLFFSRTSVNEPYANPRSREEVIALLMEEVRQHGNFVFAAVKGNYGEEILPFYTLAVQIEAPKELRMQRVRNRSFQKFGNRILEGGDLHKQEEAFFKMVESREERLVDDWLETLTCPVLRIDGTKPVDENVAWIIHQIQNMI